jgi:hypothetical protein
MLHKDYDRKGPVAKKEKSLVVSLKGLVAKTNYLAVNRQQESQGQLVNECPLESSSR